jgi:GTP-binding protein HflX
LINGNTSGLRDALLDEMERLYDTPAQRGEFVSAELLQKLADFTGQTGREISVFLSRQGKVLDVSVGDHQTVSMPYIRKRRGNLALSGVRCIHTHPQGAPMLSEVDASTLLSSRLDAMAAVSVRDGQAKSICVGFVGEKPDETVIFGPFAAGRIPHKHLMLEIAAATQRVAQQIALLETGDPREKAMLVGLNSSESSMEELSRLADTAGVDVALVETQARARDRSYYIGKGKARELSLKAVAADVDVVITDDELSPLETRNLEEILGVKVLDRTTLILDIFAKHAKTKEGKLQVELAQLKYNLPRLEGEGFVLSRLGGGIGTRGPGEKKLEVDKRRIRRRIFELEQEIEGVAEQRRLRRSEREKNRIKEVALVGYTNAGKSSLLNALSGAGVTAEDKLFATLDPVTRRVKLPSGIIALFTDTVGFIDKLPHDLVSAFRSTLEGAAYADLLLNVIDASSIRCEEQSRVVYSVLERLGASDKPVIDVYNKTDLIADLPPNSERTAFISAKDGRGISELLQMVDSMLQPRLFLVDMSLSYAKGNVLALVQEHGRDVEIDYTPEAIKIRANLPDDIAREVIKYDLGR